jgi:hypothetical protein
MLNNIPNTLLGYLLEFLDWKDFSSVTLCCKRLYEVFQDNIKFWTRECFSQYISFNLDLYSEIYQFEDFKAYSKNKIYSLQNKPWRRHLEEGEKQKKQFLQLLCENTSKEKAICFVDYFYQAMKEPTLPMIKLRRETMVQSTRTSFQNHLSEVLYEDLYSSSKNFNFFDDNKVLIDELLQHEEKIFQETLFYDKKELIQGRWYLFDTEDSSLDETMTMEEKFDDMVVETPNLNQLSRASTEELPGKKSCTSFLLSLYDCLCKSLFHFCGLIWDYLNSLDNFYDLIAEYTARWKAYVCSMLELEKTFETFTTLMNKNYESIFEGYPSFPKFSIWRLMTRIWMKKIYEKDGLSQNLQTAFLNILSNYREKNIKKILSDNSVKFEMNNLCNNELPKCLYINLKTKEKEFLPSECLNCCYLNDNIQKSYGGCIEIEKELLSDFMQSILDISLTEVSIHYLDCSELPVNCPYLELEDGLLKKTNDFYNDYQPLFSESPDYYEHFLKSDCCLFSDILVERTKWKLEKLQVDKGLQFLIHVIQEQLQKINLQELMQYQKQPILLCDQRDGVEDFIEDTVKQIVESIRKQDHSQKMNEFCSLTSTAMQVETEMCGEIKELNALNSFEYNMDRTFIQKIILHLESKYKHFRENFGYLVSQLSLLRLKIFRSKD